jgi:DNA-binding winged helix-turn-helix (wHTH) protein
VVTRDELFAEVWPDTLPTNDVLTQAVTQLRKAFSNDDDNGQAYIETIAKTGYRLLVPVQALDDAEPSAAGADDEGVDVQPAPPLRCPRARRNRAAAGAMSAAACCWRWA